jgi:hypothetical protein
MKTTDSTITPTMLDGAVAVLAVTFLPLVFSVLIPCPLMTLIRSEAFYSSLASSWPIVALPFVVAGKQLSLTYVADCLLVITNTAEYQMLRSANLLLIL